ncbi:MAG: ATP-grasp domain-containing protein [Chloroflexi bacterium]|nr:ATP-grasp domain-containing protein [Chloroflexota bacterium]MCY3687225.1 ATP-grasp domain-containing protein [Chloroflexota bacterium]MDE2707405.1 ATP-grasp domain-containing protein [Chloroflexota bacterium]
MPIQRLLVANRGEIAVRILRTATELGIATAAVHSSDDAASDHIQHAETVIELSGIGPAAYLDIDQIVDRAKEHDCDAIHPGYGFLAENADFARACEEAGITFVGPSPAALALFGDKARARTLAGARSVPVLTGTDHAVDLDGARAFFEQLDGRPMVIKAIGGGGGRGMRAISEAAEIEDAFERCTREAQAAFGNGALFVERFIPRARHIEVQIVGDQHGHVTHVGERECTIQRRYQKLIEIAPSPTLSDSLRERITAAAVELAEAGGYSNLGTFEFLVDADTGDDFAFIEANARLQVEHTVTEEVAGLDLVECQLRIAEGATLIDLGMESPPPLRGFAIQSRVNLERMREDGDVRPAAGALRTFRPPAGPGVRVDTYGYAGYAANPNFDSLIAKVVTRHPSSEFKDAVRRAQRALDEFQLEGPDSNIGFLRNILGHPEFVAGDVHTRWIDERIGELAVTSDNGASSGGQSAWAGAQVENQVTDPLAALDFFRQGAGAASLDVNRGLEEERAGFPAPEIIGPPGTEPLRAPIQGTIIEILVGEGDSVVAGQDVIIMNAMKMEHVLQADIGGIAQEITVSIGDIIWEGHPLVFIEPADVGPALDDGAGEIDLDYIRPDLQHNIDLHEALLDHHREGPVARRHAKGKRTARENIAQLVEGGAWTEYMPLGVAAQRRVRSWEELRRVSPADGLICGIGTVNAELFDNSTASTAIISYDETVWAGTQGLRGHEKTDRMVETAHRLLTPLVFIAEGAGGRSGDTDAAYTRVAARNVRTFERLAELSGRVPMVSITAGRCFAGNASMLGMCDIIVATEGSNIAMGGPAVIEGGGLGLFLPEELGPMSQQVPNGVVDIFVKDEDEAMAAVKKYLSYFQGRLTEWSAPDQRQLRHVIPENRLRTYDVRKVIDLLADHDSVLELRPEFGIGVVTALIRIEGRPVGVIANNNMHIGGAVDSDGSDKLARFAQICDCWNIPLLTLVDTPGMMVGPEVEKTALVRHCHRVFVSLANLTTPKMTITLRKCYGLGGLAMLAGSTEAGLFNVGWPTSEYGGMNLEAGVKLGARAQLEKIEDLEERTRVYEEMVADAYERGNAVNAATVLESDDVIDPAETRQWILRLLDAVPNSEPIREGRRPYIDSW